MKRRWLFLIVGGLVLVGVSVFAALASPRLLDVYPEDGSAYVLSTTSLRMTFSRPMRPESVTNAQEIEPFQEGVFTWEANTLIFTPEGPWPSGETVSVNLQAGARSTLGLPMLKGQSWSFDISPPLLAYLWPADDSGSIYALDPHNGDTFVLVEEPQGIADYQIAVDGVSIYYSTRNNAGESVIRKLDRLTTQTSDVLRCEHATCGQPRVSPQGDYLAYERLPISGEAPSGNQVWLLPLKGNDPFQVSAANHQAEGPFWSPAGQLTFYDWDAQSFVVYNPADQEMLSIHNETGGSAAWSADGRDLVLSEVDFWGNGSMDFVSHLWRYRFPFTTGFNLSRLHGIEDLTPAYSPDGRWLAFGRKYLDESQWTPGHQLWLMRADGSDPYPLTDAPDYNHADFSWHPGGKLLAYVRYNQSALTDPPEIWLISIDDSEATRLVIDGHYLQWIP
jgi:Tol biopolymer transport system component